MDVFHSFVWLQNTIYKSQNKCISSLYVVLNQMKSKAITVFMDFMDFHILSL